MNDHRPEQIITWQRGDIAIHEADSKEPYMLMVVESYNAKKEEYTLRYLNPLHSGARPIKAKAYSLLLPASFGIDVDTLRLLDLSFCSSYGHLRNRMVKA